MCTRSVTTRVVWTGLLAALCASCASVGAPSVPRGWLSRTGPGGPGGDGYGAWVVVWRGLGRANPLQGELIACRTDSLWVLTQEGGLRSWPLREVRSVDLYKGISVHGRVLEVTTWGAHEADLRPWARYPQGLPPGLDRAAVRPKPLAQP